MHPCHDPCCPKMGTDWKASDSRAYLDN
jgi:hypothetical protein